MPTALLLYRWARPRKARRRRLLNSGSSSSSLAVIVSHKMATQGPDDRPWRHLLKRRGEAEHEELFDWPRAEAKAFLIKIRQRRNTLTKRIKSIKRIMCPFFPSLPSQLLTMSVNTVSSPGLVPSWFKSLTVKQAVKEAARLADPLLIEDVMKRHRYHTERKSKKLSQERQEALDEAWKWHNDQPMSSIYDLKGSRGHRLEPRREVAR